MQKPIPYLLAALALVCLACEQPSPSPSADVSTSKAQSAADLSESDQGDVSGTSDVSNDADIIPPPPAEFEFECPPGTTYKNRRGGGYVTGRFEYWCDNEAGEKDGMLLYVSDSKYVLSETIPYRSGVHHGRYQAWLHDGELLIEGNYVDDKKDGVWFWYFRNGEIEHQCKFSRGVVDAGYKDDQFCVDAITPRKPYQKPPPFVLPELDCPKHTAFRAYTSYYAALSGARIMGSECGRSFARRALRWGARRLGYSLEAQLPDFRHGPAADYTEKRGTKVFEGQFDHNRRVGKETRWFADGQMVSEGNWVEGKRQGDWTWWLSSGDVLARCTFDDGVLTSAEAKKELCKKAEVNEIPLKLP